MLIFRRRKLLALISHTAFFITFLGTTNDANAQWVSAQWSVMGTSATLEYWRDDNLNSTTESASLDNTLDDPIVTEVRHEFERLNQLLSPWIPESELAQVNARAAQEAVTISPEFMALLKKSEDYFLLTHGAFDISFASAGFLYDYRAGKSPNAEQLKKARQLIGFEHIKMTENTVRFTADGVSIDLGGIAKGYAIDQAVAVLRQHNIAHAYVALGGDSYVLGDRRGRDWQVGIQHPRNDKAVAMTLPVSDIAVSTSGDYERFFIRDGERIHHILNPGTGTPSKELVSVTIMTAHSIDADALSTSVFVMGPEKGLEMINQLEDVSAVLINPQGQVTYSDDLAEPSANKNP